MPYVITCGDEGVQVNVGTRLAIVGAGVMVPKVSLVFSALKKLLGNDLRIAASGENDWIKQTLNLNTYEQADAAMQQHVASLADQEKLLYAGFFPFADPKNLSHDVKGHMVRPKGVHIANKIGFTLAGGEQKYNLGKYQISAEWLHLVDKKVAQEIIKLQVDFYNRLSEEPLTYVLEEAGELDAKLVAKNKKILLSFGYNPVI